ncbi:MAG: hypothetical protein R2843_15100 [Thermomicrobiales bacterium]
MRSGAYVKGTWRRVSEALVEEATIPGDPTTLTGSGPSTPRIDGPQAAETLAAVAEHDADLALETIPRLPVAARVDPLRQLLALTDSNEECTRRFQLLRHRFPDDAKSLETTLQTLLANVSKRNPSWRGNADWLEALELTDDEKVRAAGALMGMGGDQGVDGMPEPTKWLADFLPPSKERDFILWRHAAHGLWPVMDPDGAKAFLQQNSIDEEEMKRLESEGFLRPY